ncbi:MAG: GH3 auxin-responsive promoter family protein, partial [Nitrospira sp.]|nr:GH3 auxin-responsive promoter family protein [Nitrospira sp.]
MRHAEKFWHPFMERTQDPAGSQRLLLHNILRRQADTVFGRKHSFNRIRSYAEYRTALPVHGYEDLRSSIEEQDRNREPVLTVDQPIQFAQTSGTTGQPKFIPVCRSTRTSIARYQWLFARAQYHGVPGIFDDRILVLSGQSVEGYLESGTPYGSMSGLLFEGLPSPLRRKDVLPPPVRAMTDVKAKYRHIAACALAEPMLSVMAAPNPTTFLKLMEIIRKDYWAVLEILSAPNGGGEGVPRASTRRLEELKAYGNSAEKLTFANLWPSLKAVITWTGGNCGILIPKLRPLLPETAAVIEMGYLSSECLGSLNVDVVNNRCIPTFHEHLFEFVPLAEWECENPNTCLLDEVEVGG